MTCRLYFLDTNTGEEETLYTLKDRDVQEVVADYYPLVMDVMEALERIMKVDLEVEFLLDHSDE